MKQIYTLHGEGESMRAIARTLGVLRNTVRKYLQSPGVPKAAPRKKRLSKLDGYPAYIRKRSDDGLDNCVVLLRELRERGYLGGYTILKDYVKSFRRRADTDKTVRFETGPGEQAQVDWGLFGYVSADGTTRSIWAFVMVLGWSRAMYVEFVRKADVATFIRCHVNAFRRLGVPQRCLYDNAKVEVLGRTEAGQPMWNPRFLDFALGLGFDIELCRPYRAQTKGRVEAGVRYVRRNFWPAVRFEDDLDLNRQAQAWVDGIANVRIHGTTHERPYDRLLAERAHLPSLAGDERVTPFIREGRRVARAGYVHWERGYYGVPWTWAGKLVEVQAGPDAVEISAGDGRIALHPRARKPGRRFTVPGQWEGLVAADQRSQREALAVQVPTVEVECRPLAIYEALSGAAMDR